MCPYNTFSSSPRYAFSKLFRGSSSSSWGDSQPPPGPKTNPHFIYSAAKVMHSWESRVKQFMRRLRVKGLARVPNGNITLPSLGFKPKTSLSYELPVPIIHRTYESQIPHTDTQEPVHMACRAPGRTDRYHHVTFNALLLHDNVSKQETQITG